MVTNSHISRKIKVLIVDDSAMVRKALNDILSSDPEIEIVGLATNPYEARDLLVTKNPDVLTLDIEMPKMDGVTFLKKFMRKLPTPTVIISSLAEEGKKITIDAMAAGAVDVITKPKIGVLEGLESSMNEIITRVKNAAKADVSNYKQRELSQTPVEPTVLYETTDKVIGIGASTGGVESLAKIMPYFPSNTPGIVMVQHMPEGYTKSFADRLSELSKINVKEASDGDRILPGTALLAPGGTRHMEVIRSGGQYRVRLFEGDKVSFNRPSVDVMFDSIAKHVRANTACVLMTGMGKDGAKGLLNVKNAKGRTFIQDEKTCIVYGMPGEAEALNAHEQSLSLMDIPNALIHALDS